METSEVGWNDALRLLLELGALFGLGAGGWSIGRGPWSWVLMLGLPVAAAALWGTFRVPGDPGPAPLAVPGWLRLLLEVVVLGGGAVGLAVAYGSGPGWIFAATTVFHYSMSVGRVRWLLKR